VLANLIFSPCYLFTSYVDKINPLGEVEGRQQQRHGEIAYESFLKQQMNLLQEYNIGRQDLRKYVEIDDDSTLTGSNNVDWFNHLYKRKNYKCDDKLEGGRGETEEERKLNAEGLNLVLDLLRIDPVNRLTTEEALNHDFFK